MGLAIVADRIDGSGLNQVLRELFEINLEC